VRPSRFLLLCGFVGLFQVSVAPDLRATPKLSSPSASEHSDQKAVNSQPTDNSVTIPGPLRSFLRMAGISQQVSQPEVLPVLSHTVILHGYQLGRATEYLVLLRRYVRQSKELTGLAVQGQTIRVSGCKDADNLLRILGYREQGECGKSEMSLVTADPERAFLTVDSGFPLLDLEEALEHDAPFTYPYAGSTVPVMYSQADWVAIAAPKGDEGRDLLDALLYEPQLARLYWAMSRIEPATRDDLKKNVGLAKLLPMAPTLDLYGSQLCIRDGHVVLPGGQAGEKQWQDLVGANPGKPTDFIPQLLTKDRGWLAAYYDAMARANPSQQEHFVQKDRLKAYYKAFKSPGVSDEAGSRLPFRPAPAVMVLVERMQWDSKGDPYVPGSLQAWGGVLQQKPDAKLMKDWSKHANSWKSPDQLAEAMFAYSRLEMENGPLQAYLCLSELDHMRGPGRRLNDQTVTLLATKFSDYSDQYMIFLEFPDLSDDAITRFMNTADAINKISDHTLRGNAMGIFQANVGLWQILARQGQISRAQQNSSWLAMIKPFSDVSSPAQVFTAGRASFEEVFKAATGRSNPSQEEIINLLAGTRQTTPEGQQVHLEVANRIRTVLEDQRLVSVDTLFALDDGLKNPSKAKTDELVAYAGELREFEMPQPIFSNSERTRWAAGTYNNRHTELQMKTDLVKAVKAPDATPKQRDLARGQLATFLRDILVGMNYAYYEPPGSQALHNNPLFVRSHDFSGDTVMGVERLWQAPHLFGEGSPAGGGAHLIGSLADLPYVLAEAEQDFIAPDHVQALIWQQFVPGLLSNAIVPRWWDISRNELHAVALYQRAGDELLTASSNDEKLLGEVLTVLSDRLFPERQAWLAEMMREGKTNDMMGGIAPSDSFYLTAEFQQRYPQELERASAAGRELGGLQRQDPDAVSLDRLSRDFGVVHPVFVQTYGREFISVRPFPALGGNYSRLMGECWDSGNLYWARLADEMGYSPVQLNRLVPGLTRRMVEQISASEIDDWPATLRALRETGEEFRQGKISNLTAGIAEPGK
jgi:hypothetical protein